MAGAQEITDDLTATGNFTGISYTAAKSYTSPTSGATYEAQASSQNGFQIRTTKSNTGISVTTAPEGMVVKEVTITMGTAGNGVNIYAGDASIPRSVTGNTDKLNESAITTTTTVTVGKPYFTIVPAGSAVTIVSGISVVWEKTGVTDTREEADLAFPQATYTANLGEMFDSPAVANPHDLTLIWTSSDTSVATVESYANNVGFIVLKKAGTTIITAETEATDTYKAGKASYTLIVKDPNQKNYTLITSLDQIGDEANVIIACTTEKKVMSATIGDNTYGSEVEAEVNADNTITPKEAFAIVKVKKEGTAYSFQLVNGDKKDSYLTYSGSRNTLNFSDALKTGKLSISEAADVKIILGTSDSRYIQYNSTTPRFACYTGSQKNIQLYLVEKIEAVEPAEPDLSFNFGGGSSQSGNEITVTDQTVVGIASAVPGYTVWYSFKEGNVATVAAEDGFEIVPSTGLTFANSGTLSLYTVNDTTGEKSKTVDYSIVVDNTVSVAELGVEAADAQYFTLQGVRVENPQQGLFIKVQNGKAAKVLVK